MPEKLAIVGASGKLGFATLTSLLDHQLIAPENIICTTSSTTGASKLQPLGVEVRSAEWDDQTSWNTALQGCTKLFLISSARIQKDFNDAPPNQGRESDHFAALEAAKQVDSVKHVYYTSLAFANPSLSRVMKAHERTEEYLKKSGLTYTIIREGLYNESWPLYLGHYDLPNDDRNEIVVAGDSKISWTSIEDLGLATAIVLTSTSGYENKTLYLAQRQAYSLTEVAAMVGKARGREVKLKVVSRGEHEKYYVEERGKSEPFIKWWSKTYDALRANECEIEDETLEKLLRSKGLEPKSMQETVQEMLTTTD